MEFNTMGPNIFSSKFGSCHLKTTLELRITRANNSLKAVPEELWSKLFRHHPRPVTGDPHLVVEFCSNME